MTNCNWNNYLACVQSKNKSVLFVLRPTLCDQRIEREVDSSRMIYLGAFRRLPCNPSGSGAVSRPTHLRHRFAYRPHDRPQKWPYSHPSNQLSSSRRGWGEDSGFIAILLHQNDDFAFRDILTRDSLLVHLSAIQFQPKIRSENVLTVI